MRARVREAGNYACYYGQGALERLEAYDLVILQPSHYSSASIAYLAARDTVAVAYISLGEDTSGVEGPWLKRDWRRKVKWNPNWGSRLVNPSHPSWRERCLARAQASMEAGFAGLFLDTVDAHTPLDQRGLVDLIRSLRSFLPEAALVMNRGFSLHRRVLANLDAVMFESLSTTWVLGPGGVEYRRVDPKDLVRNLVLAEKVARAALPLGVNCLALDYADSPELAAFAAEQAANLDYLSFVSDRDLTRI